MPFETPFPRIVIIYSLPFKKYMGETERSFAAELHILHKRIVFNIIFYIYYTKYI